MIGGRIFVVLPSVGQFPLEAHPCLFRPCPVSNQASEPVDRRALQRSIPSCFCNHARSPELLLCLSEDVPYQSSAVVRSRGASLSGCLLPRRGSAAWCTA